MVRLLLLLFISLDKKKNIFVYTGKICGYDLSLHKHDDILDEITANIPFIIELNNNQAILKLKSNFDTLDCEVKQTYRLFIRAYDCAPNDKRRYSERYVKKTYFCLMIHISRKNAIEQ
jgi:hypothetical protein